MRKLGAVSMKTTRDGGTGVAVSVSTKVRDTLGSVIDNE